MFRKTLVCLSLAAAAAGFTVSPASAATPPEDVQPNIVGGGPAAEGAYPFMVSLQDKEGTGNGHDRHFCGASLISPWTVLTAAHCVRGADAAALQVVVGTTVLSSGAGEKRDIAEVAVHPKYDFPQYDVAVLQLKEPVRDVDAPLLPSRGTDALERPGATARVIGWGNTIEQSPDNPGNGNTSYPDRLQEVDVPLVSRTECAAANPDTTIDDTLVCAGVSHKDSCQGDSGGPLLRQATLGDGRKVWFQIGIVSGGEGCAATGAPGYYSRIGNAEINDFIREHA
ncbi:S1 family peptidase [Amycolatopsis nigrescens]|uniref:S1 family peptidase n=1 Tax=Amycolatopsis nigrescens TaxID=381445 RepID=UPI00035CE19D|nr:serine protease [Amycolatopsis nigrescens]